MKRQKEKELKKGQLVWSGTEVYIFDSYDELTSEWYIYSISGEFYPEVYTKPTPLTKSEIQAYLQLLGWFFQFSFNNFTKLDGDTNFYIEKYKGKWILVQPAFRIGDEFGETYWESDEDFDNTIEFLKEAKVLINCLNVSL